MRKKNIIIALVISGVLLIIAAVVIPPVVVSRKNSSKASDSQSTGSKTAQPNTTSPIVSSTHAVLSTTPSTSTTIAPTNSFTQQNDATQSSSSQTDPSSTSASPSGPTASSTPTGQLSTTPVVSTSAASSTTPSSTHAPSLVPAWANGALVADVTWSEVYDSTLAGEVKNVLSKVMAQNVTVAEADIDLSFNKNETQFNATLKVAATSAQVAKQLGIHQVWYYPSLEIITDKALVNGELQPYAFSQQHPDWIQRSLVGNISNSFSDPNVVFWVTQGQESAWASPNSPWRDIYIDRIRRLVRVGVNGVWPDVPIYFDGIVVWCDQSEWDRNRFAVDTNGMPFPTKVDWYSEEQSGVSFRRWISWRHETIAQFLRDIADGCRQESEDCLIVIEVVTMDYHDASNLGLDGSYLKLIPNLMVVWEVDVMSEDTGMRYALENDWIRLICMYKYGRAASGNKPSWAFSYGLREDDAESVMAEVIIAGNSPYEVKTPTKEKGVDAGVANSTFRQRWYSWSLAYNDLLFQSPRRSLAKVLVYHSSATRDFVYPEPYGSGLMCNNKRPSGANVWWATDRESTCYFQKYIGEYSGTAKALLQKQIPFDTMTSPGLVDADLAGYEVVMGPLLTAVSDNEVNLFRQWVYNGGLLILTGANPFGMDQHGNNRTSFALADAFGFDRSSIPNSASVSYGSGRIVFFKDLIGLANLNVSSTALTDPIYQFKPPRVRLPNAHRCVHFEMNQPVSGSSYVLQFNNYVGVCETAITSRQETNGTWPVLQFPQTLSIELDLNLPTQQVGSVKESDPNIVPAQMTDVFGWTVVGSTLYFQITLSVYKIVHVVFAN